MEIVPHKALKLLRKEPAGAKVADYYLQSNPGLPYPKFICEAALAYFHNNRQPDALRILRSATESFPNNEYAPNMLAQLLDKSGDTKAAIAQLRDNLRRFPNNEVAPNMLAQLLDKSGDTKAAIAQLRDNLRRFPNNEYAPDMLAQLLDKSGDTKAAIAQLRDNIRCFPNNEVAPTMLAQLLFKTGERKEAAALLASKPDNVVSQTMLASEIAREGRFRECLDILMNVFSKELSTHSLSVLTTLARHGIGVQEHRQIMRMAKALCLISEGELLRCTVVSYPKAANLDTYMLPQTALSDMEAALTSQKTIFNIDTIPEWQPINTLAAKVASLPLFTAVAQR